MKPICVVGTVAVVILAALSAAGQTNNAIPFLYPSLSPTSITPGSAAFQLTVNGTGFAPTAVVNWNGVPQLTEVISSSQAKASISASYVAVGMTAWISVTNPAPGGGTSNVVFFPVTNPSATIGMAVSQPFPGAIAVVVGDFNNDGKLDVGWIGNGVFNVSLGNSTGGFKPALTVPVFEWSEVVAGDFNGDGKLDVAGIENGSGVIEAWLGNGDGTFTQSWLFTPAQGSGTHITAADFYGSGQLDLWTAGQDLGLRWFSIWSGVGNGTFNVPATFETNSFPEPTPSETLTEMEYWIWQYRNTLVELTYGWARWVADFRSWAPSPAGLTLSQPRT